MSVKPRALALRKCELGDNCCVLIINSRGGAAGLSAGTGSTGTGRAGRLRIDGSNTGLGSMQTRYNVLLSPSSSATFRLDISAI